MWGAADQIREVVDAFLQKKPDVRAAKRFFKQLLKKHKGASRGVATDKLLSSGVAHIELIPYTVHNS